MRRKPPSWQLLKPEDALLNIRDAVHHRSTVASKSASVPMTSPVSKEKEKEKKTNNPNYSTSNYKTKYNYYCSTNNNYTNNYKFSAENYNINLYTNNANSNYINNYTNNCNYNDNYNSSYTTRSGSVIVDFIVKLASTADSKDGTLVDANADVVTNLRDTGLSPMPDSVAQSSRYECWYTTSSGLNILWEDINYIEQYPSIQTTPSRTYRCSNHVKLSCCVYEHYDIQLNQGIKVVASTTASTPVLSQQKCIQYPYQGECGSDMDFVCSLTNTKLSRFLYSSNTINVKISKAPLADLSPNQPITCYNMEFGLGTEGDKATGSCEMDEVGSKTGECNSSGTWKVILNNCVLRVFETLKQESQSLDMNNVKLFVEKVTEITKQHVDEVSNSTGNVATIITLLNTIANASQNIEVDQGVIKNFLETVDIISSNQTQTTWATLNVESVSQGNSSLLLKSLEYIVKSVSKDIPDFKTNSTEFRKTTITDQPFSQTFGNDSATIFISNTTLTKNLTITTLAFFSLNIILPSRNESVNDTLKNTINAIIVLVSPSRNQSINNATLSFKKLNTTDKLANPECVFWNFNLYNTIGGWDSFGCKKKTDVQGIVTCECNHTTSFSILMSPSIVNFVPLSTITYVGVGVSVVSLVVFLIIEAIFWKPITKSSSTRSPMLNLRHISLVNIAVSLLIANICFIFGAAIAKADTVSISLCSAAAFFTHFFYLALFFWMLVSALLLLYSVTVVFSSMSKTSMMAISFSVGYGAPLIIAVTTVASTVGGEKYIAKKSACWLNWDESRALLAFAVPALFIVFINFLVMIVVLVKMLKKKVGERTSDEKNAMAVIARFVVVLTPVFGITWGLGLGIMIKPESEPLHYLFGILNSFQGFFVAVLGTLFDRKVGVLMLFYCIWWWFEVLV
ncbi:adhesion G-protein coupled receptor F1 [Salminus brasiliensis]|uniref:adhesion G-protein coupled receptor F1 n=1 Tax=Salminus brasiliensis TaxID=930266 RepID=UPI003B838E5A